MVGFIFVIAGDYVLEEDFEMKNCLVVAFTRLSGTGFVCVVFLHSTYQHSAGLIVDHHADEQSATKATVTRISCLCF